jgi:hypothetical protein
MKNSFLNLAVPIMQISEPGKIKRKKINSFIEFSLWERWDFTLDKNSVLSELF